jgi:hypothetical protein
LKLSIVVSLVSFVFAVRHSIGGQCGHTAAANANYKAVTART